MAGAVRANLPSPSNFRLTGQAWHDKIFTENKGYSRPFVQVYSGFNPHPPLTEIEGDGSIFSTFCGLLE